MSRMGQVSFDRSPFPSSLHRVWKRSRAPHYCSALRLVTRQCERIFRVTSNAISRRRASWRSSRPTMKVERASSVYPNGDHAIHLRICHRIGKVWRPPGRSSRIAQVPAKDETGVRTRSSRRGRAPQTVRNNCRCWNTGRCLL